MRKTFFYYNQLPGEAEKRFYKAIIQAIRDEKTSAKIQKAFLEKKSVEQVLYAINYDYPELFYVELFDECSFTRYSNGDIEMNFRYLYDSNERYRKVRQNERFLKDIISRVPEKVKSSEYLKALWLHDLIAVNVTYDHQALVGDKPEAYSIEGSIQDKTAVCSGIARLYMMLCERMDLFCTYIDGETHLSEADKADNVEGKSGRHAWNLLRLEGIYTYVDVTWDLREEKQYISHTYFGMWDALAEKTRTPDKQFESIQLPFCKGPNMTNYFVKRHIYFRGYKEFVSFFDKMIKNHKQQFCFQLDPGKMDSKPLRKKVEDFVAQYINKSSNDVKSWTWICNEDMMTFYYTIVYR